MPACIWNGPKKYFAWGMPHWIDLRKILRKVCLGSIEGFTAAVASWHLQSHRMPGNSRIYCFNGALYTRLTSPVALIPHGLSVLHSLSVQSKCAGLPPLVLAPALGHFPQSRSCMPFPNSFGLTPYLLPSHPAMDTASHPHPTMWVSGHTLSSKGITTCCSVPHPALLASWSSYACNICCPLPG